MAYYEKKSVHKLPVKEKNVIQLSIDESIKRLKAEIIAQDWGLSEKRIDLLEAAFFCLKKRFKNRKAAHAILIMAGSVLDYVKRRGESSPSDSIDFLKESMAHVVNLYETDDFDPDEDEKVFKGLYLRFNFLKEKIKAEKSKGKGSAESSPAVQLEQGSEPGEGDKEEQDVLVQENVEHLIQKVSDLRDSDITLEKGEVDRLVDDLQSSLERAEYVGETIRQLLSELIAVKDKIQHMQDPEEPLQTNERDWLEEPEEEEEPRVQRVVERSHSAVKNCPATELREIVLGETSVYVQESAISLIREVQPAKQKQYLKNSNVPLKDLTTLFQKLSKQFKGSLANIPDKKLKKLSLPIMVPTGMGLPDMPDENGTKLVFVTNGQWNGIFVCSEVGTEAVTMVKFKKAKNGDLVGTGYAEDGAEFPLLNIVTVLRREGFLTMV